MYLSANGDDSGIFREELIVILAAILSRMASERLEKHLVIPVCSIPCHPTFNH